MAHHLPGPVRKGDLSFELGRGVDLARLHIFGDKDLRSLFDSFLQVQPGRIHRRPHTMHLVSG